MAAALARTQPSGVSFPLQATGEIATGACFAPRLGLPVWPPAGAPTSCVEPDAGTVAHAPVWCSDPDGLHARVEPPVLGPDGAPYPGDLLPDILEYRSLRATMLAGHRIDPDAHARYLELETLLRTHDDGTDRPHLRAFHRFDVQLRAAVRYRIGRQRAIGPARVENISAGGVKLSMTDTPALGEQVWLQLPLPGGAVAVLPSRVIWVRDGAIGLMFAGAPRWT